NNKTDGGLAKVLVYGEIVIGAVVLSGALFPDSSGEISSSISVWITDYFGWDYMILTTLLVLFCVFLLLSQIGKLRLGKLSETPEAMLESMRSTFFHYGFHAWAMYGVVALALAYSQFRKGEVGLLSKVLRPLFGDRVDGLLGIIVDVMAVFATVLFLMSAWSGLSKGIQYLSNLNMILTAMLFIVILVVGPTILILNMMTAGTGQYLCTFLIQSFDVAPLNEQYSEWMSTWTVYYWGWWMSWSLFV